LVWTLFAPVDPVGEWRSRAAAPPSDSVFSEFDPFFRRSNAGAATALNLKLYGVREDRATGRGSAILALPDGSQRSFGVGEEIMPGVTLASVGFDSVTINRGAVGEQIFLDQSRPPLAVTDTVAPETPVEPDSQIRFQPRMGSGGVNGLRVGPGSDGGYALEAAGLMPGDVILSINGERIASFDQARGIVRRARGEVSLMVERGGRQVSLRASLDL
jgi:general secretion pathway protein C